MFPFTTVLRPFCGWHCLNAVLGFSLLGSHLEALEAVREVLHAKLHGRSSTLQVLRRPDCAGRSIPACEYSNLSRQSKVWPVGSVLPRKGSPRARDRGGRARGNLARRDEVAKPGMGLPRSELGAGPPALERQRGVSTLATQYRGGPQSAAVTHPGVGRYACVGTCE